MNEKILYAHGLMGKTVKGNNIYVISIFAKGINYISFALPVTVNEGEEVNRYVYLTCPSVKEDEELFDIILKEIRVIHAENGISLFKDYDNVKLRFVKETHIEDIVEENV